ncbi:MAG: hypothetical protein NTV44_02190 [Firmicutes bacterium]|nr:hypothetical protein [Bacillota bacterium]
MKMRFKNLNENNQIMVMNAVFLALIAICFLPFCFEFPSTVMFSLLYGWLIGGVISVICFALLVSQINALTSDDAGVRIRSMTLYFGRFLLYAVGLGLAGYLYYIDIPVINIFAVCAAYMPIRLIIVAYKRKVRLQK